MSFPFFVDVTVIQVAGLFLQSGRSIAELVEFLVQAFEGLSHFFGRRSRAIIILAATRRASLKVSATPSCIL